MESIAIFKVNFFFRNILFLVQIQHPEPPKINEDENFMLSQAKIGKMYKAVNRLCFNNVNIEAKAKKNEQIRE